VEINKSLYISENKQQACTTVQINNKLYNSTNKQVWSTVEIDNTSVLQCK